MASNQAKRYFGLGLLIVSVAVITYVVYNYKTKPSEIIVEPVDTLVVEEPKMEFGFLVDSFDVHKGEIQRNQFLADILLKYHVSYPEIDRLVKTADTIFDVRKMRAGKNYTIFCSKDSLGKALHFVYQPSLVEYIVFDMRDSINVYKGRKEIVLKKKFASGIINSSLYLTLQEKEVNPVLSLEMADIYAWTIDFYRIQKGDMFKVAYEEGFVEGESIGIGKIKSALFTHKDRDFYAFYFEQDSIGDYFDEKAQSLRKAFLKMPLKFGRLSSSFSLRRFHPVQKRYKAHLGTDYAAPRGTPILAVGDGTVIESSYKGYNGNYVKIKHNSSYTTQYLHMSKRAVKVGEVVKQGEVIGYVGSTGLATGPHVCFRFWKFGKQVDHRQEDFPPSKPVNEALMEEYSKLMKTMKQKLDSVGV